MSPAFALTRFWCDRSVETASKCLKQHHGEKQWYTIRIRILPWELDPIGVTSPCMLFCSLARLPGQVVYSHSRQVLSLPWFWIRQVVGYLDRSASHQCEVRGKRFEKIVDFLATPLSPQKKTFDWTGQSRRNRLANSCSQAAESPVSVSVGEPDPTQIVLSLSSVYVFRSSSVLASIFQVNYFHGFVEFVMHAALNTKQDSWWLQSVCIGVEDSNSASSLNSGKGGFMSDCSADG